MSDYAVVLVSYRRPDLVRGVLAQLATQSIAPSHVLVVDNSGDLPPESIEGPLASITEIIARPDNPGYGAAVNLARAASQAEYLLALTHDAVFDDTLAERLIAAAGAKEVGAAAPVLYRRSTGEIFSAGGLLTSGGRAYHRTATGAATGVTAVDWVDGAIVMYSRSALDEVRWLKEEYFLYFEDVEIGWRLRAHGYLVVVENGTKAYQEPGAHPTYLGIRNMTLFAQESGIPRLRSWGSVARRTLEDGAVAMLHGHLPPVAAAWRGRRDGMRGRSGKPDERPA